MSTIDSVIQRLSQARAVLSPPMTINSSGNGQVGTQVGGQAIFGEDFSGVTLESQMISVQLSGGQTVTGIVGGNTSDGQTTTVQAYGGQGGNSNTGASPINHGLHFGGEGTQSVYTEDRLVELVTEDVPGAGDNRLNELMEDMQSLDPNDRPAVEAMMTEIADIRGTDPQDMINDFDSMTDIMDQNNLSFDDINENLHPDFMGSEVHLSYGNVVGTSIGLDPVFGAMMNPSGGLTGPGNDSLPTDPNSAITMHGIAHDASGFLYNSLNIGYGYDYVPHIPGAPWFLNDFLSSDNPLAGQWNGVAYWEGILHNNPVSYTLGTVGDFVDLGTEFIDLTFQAGGDWLSNNVPLVGGVLGWGLDGLGNVVGGFGDIVDSGTDIAADFFNSTVDLASDAWDGVTDFASDTWDSATDFVSDTWDSATDFASDTWDSFSGWASDTWSSVTDWGSDSSSSDSSSFSSSSSSSSSSSTSSWGSSNSGSSSSGIGSMDAAASSSSSSSNSSSSNSGSSSSGIGSMDAAASSSSSSSNSSSSNSGSSSSGIGSMDAAASSSSSSSSSSSDSGSSDSDSSSSSSSDSESSDSDSSSSSSNNSWGGYDLSQD